MKKIVITTVGTSLIEKLKVKTDKSLKTTFRNGNEDIHIAETKANFEKDLAEKFAEKNAEDNSICAELQTINKIRKTYPDLEVYLLCTDTILSPICAKFIAQRLGLADDKIKVITGLVVDGTNASTTFEEVGFPNLIEEIKKIETTRRKQIDDELLDKKKEINEQKLMNNLRDLEILKSREKEKATKPILNISGGYKAMIPIMTLIGQIYEMELNYIYEDAEDLIEIGNLPISFDWGIVEELYFFLDATILFSEDFTKDNTSINIIKKLSDYKLIDRKKKITALGQLFKQHVTDKMPDNKTTIGVLVEYKLLEYFHNVNEVQKNYFIRRSVDMVENYKKVSDADLLWEHKTKTKEFIPFEVKSFYQIANDDIFSGRDKKKSVKGQFEKQMDFIKKCWGKPNKVRYVVYQTSAGYNISKFQKDLHKNLKELKAIVDEKFNKGVKEEDKVSFEVDILNIPLNEFKNSYTEFLQKPLKKNHYTENIKF